MSNQKNASSTKKERPGTVKWATAQLTNANPTISQNRYDNICVTAIIEGKLRIVAFWAGDIDDPSWDDKGLAGTGTVYAKRPYQQHYNSHASLVDMPLTPAAEKLVQEFIDECVQMLHNYIESN